MGQLWLANDPHFQYSRQGRELQLTIKIGRSQFAWLCGRNQLRTGQLFPGQYQGVALTEAGIRELQNYAESIELAQDIPENDEEIVARIGDADAVLLSANSRLEADVMTQAPNLRYVGMCCSLYSEESANVDIPYARAHGIEVKGIRDYGDHGVVEYVIYQLVKLLHGYEGRMWKSAPMEITGLKHMKKIMNMTKMVVKTLTIII